MLTIICGEDIAGSRNYFQSVKAEYRKKGYEIRTVTASEVDDMSRWLAESPMLFNPKIAYFSDGVIRSLKRKKSKAAYAQIDDLAKDKTIEWFDWENGLTAREITGLKNQRIQEFKPSETIFQYMEKCVPGNLAGFVKSGDMLLETNEEGFLFAMLSKHVRSLITVRVGAPPKSMQTWQAGKLRTQASRWQLDKLVSFYEGLARIDASLKTSANVHGIKKSVDILACYYL